MGKEKKHKKHKSDRWDRYESAQGQGNVIKTLLLTGSS